MNLFFSAIIGRDRHTGEIVLIASATQQHCGDGPATDVLAASARLISDEGAEIRARFSHALVIINNNARSSFNFPPPEKRGEKASFESEIKDATQARDAALLVFFETQCDGESVPPLAPAVLQNENGPEVVIVDVAPTTTSDSTPPTESLPLTSADAAPPTKNSAEPGNQNADSNPPDLASAARTAASRRRSQ